MEEFFTSRAIVIASTTRSQLRSVVVLYSSNLLFHIYEFVNLVCKFYLKKIYIYITKKSSVNSTFRPILLYEIFFRNIPPSIVIKLRM